MSSVTAQPLPASPPYDKLATALAFLLGLATIGGAWASQLWGGLVPCDLCLEQRMAYYWGLPVLALILIMWNRLPLAVWYTAMVVAVAIFAWGCYMGSFHAGVEWGFWPGPSACTGTGTASGIGTELDLNGLGSLNDVKVVPCDVVQFRFLGISLAGYNALISLLIVGLLVVAIANQAMRRRTRA